MAAGTRAVWIHIHAKAKATRCISRQARQSKKSPLVLVSIAAWGNICDCREGAGRICAPAPLLVLLWLRGHHACQLPSSEPQVPRASWAPLALVDVISSFSFLTHFNAITSGVIDLRDLVFFTSLIAFFLYANMLIVDLGKGG